MYNWKKQKEERELFALIIFILLSIICLESVVFAVITDRMTAKLCKQISEETSQVLQNWQDWKTEHQEVVNSIEENEKKVEELETKISELEKQKEVEDSEKVELEEDKETRPLEEILADPENATIGELIPYLKGTYENNLYLLSHLAMGEARGGTDVSQEANFRVAVIRAFDPEVSNGDGDLKSAIFYPNQYSCVQEGGGFWQEPDEQCLRNAENFLNGDLIEPEKGIEAFFIGTCTRHRTLESVYPVNDWRTSDPNDTMMVYVYEKW